MRQSHAHDYLGADAQYVEKQTEWNLCAAHVFGTQKIFENNLCLQRQDV